ncbi:UPF0481 protein At3g47200-like [Diospyros lotus]|uniref:UPF0481 protein At3g47200-like n=1 Tax=Diospyros lotus TaxID=55363 RepID=UPI0022583D8F|nr:UPF0481 protein At3g47200-like [Diospyros lotus]
MGDWVLDFEAELNNLRNAQSQEEQRRKKRSIHRLPPLIISDLDKKVYEPEMVSFGPYHYGEPRLKPMEDHKHRALLYFLDRTRVSLDTIFNSMVGVEQDLKDSYDSLQPEWQNDTKKFVKLMIVDGCFTLEILRAKTQKPRRDYSDDNPIFGPHGELYAMPFIKRDMLLLENQLPMLVLYMLKSFEENIEGNTETLNDLILAFCGQGGRIADMGKCLHILDLYRRSLLYKIPKANSIPPAQHMWDTIARSATELAEAGIRFKRSESNSLLDITFEHGVLSLPQLVVDASTESIFLNLIAFERCHVVVGNYLCSYIWFMSNIVQQDPDISLLRSKGIIFNFAGSDKAVDDLFNTVSKDLMMDPSSDLYMVFESTAFYCAKRWHKLRATLIHNYPWTGVSIVAGVILFVLTTLQTVFTIFDVLRK